jgi:hypothetical protein
VSTLTQHAEISDQLLLNSSGSLAMFAAIRRASSLVSSNVAVASRVVKRCVMAALPKP